MATRIPKEKTNGTSTDEEVDHPDPSAGMSASEIAQEFPDIARIQAILASHEISGGKVRIHRKGPTDTKFAYVVSVPAEQFDIDWIRNTYGGGDYQCKTFRGNGQMYKAFDFSIDHRLKGSVDGTPAAAPNNSFQQMAAMANAMKGDSGESMTMLAKMMESSADRQAASQQLMITMIMESNKVMMASMAAAMQASSANRPTDPGLTYMPLMLEMVRGGGKSGTDIVQLVTAMKELKTLTDGTPAEKDESTMFDKILSVAGPVLQGLLTRTPIPMPVAQVAPERPMAIPAPPVRIAEPKPAPGVLAEVKAYADMLISSARRNAPVEPIAELVTSQLNDDQLNGLLDTLETSDWMDRLAVDEPRIRDHAVWFSKLRDCLIAEVIDETSPEEGSTDLPNADTDDSTADSA